MSSCKAIDARSAKQRAAHGFTGRGFLEIRIQGPERRRAMAEIILEHREHIALLILALVIMGCALLDFMTWRASGRKFKRQELLLALKINEKGGKKCR
jgi:hypothetical protein